MANLDIPVLDFALQLSYLQAEFYSWAAFGRGIPQCEGMSTGGQKANLTEAVQPWAEEFANNEIAHVNFLEGALGEAASPCPMLDIGQAFSDAANAAVGDAAPLQPIDYSPYYSDSWFGLGAFIFADVAVTAYNGAAGLITDKTFLQAAAGILAVEAYQAGAVRTYLTGIASDELTPYTLTVAQGVAAVSGLRASVGGGKDQDIAPVDTASNIIPADDNAIAYARSTDEVLAIVYLGGEGQGGWFPEGLNGMIA